MITNIDLMPITTTLKEPFEFSSGKIDQLKGFLIKLEEESVSGYGEFCIWGKIEESDLRFINNPYKYLEQISSNTFENLFSPFLEYAISQALYEINLRKSGINDNNDNIITLNAVVPINKVYKLRTALNSLIQKGFSCIKVKLNDNQSYVDNVLSMLSEYENIQFRLDPNQSWDEKFVEQIYNKLKNINLEYLEEPCKNIDEIKKIKENFGLEIALDEMVRDFSSARKYISESVFNYFVIKPPTIGSIHKNISLIELAKDKSKKIIISSMLENSLSHEYHALLASKVDNNCSHGLATLFNIQNPLTPFGILTSNKLNFNLNILKHDLMNDRLA